MRDSSGRVLFFPAALLHSHLYYRYICSNRVAPQLVVLRSYIPEQIAQTTTKIKLCNFFFFAIQLFVAWKQAFCTNKKKIAHERAYAEPATQQTLNLTQRKNLLENYQVWCTTFLTMKNKVGLYKQTNKKTKTYTNTSSHHTKKYHASW